MGIFGLMSTSKKGKKSGKNAKSFAKHIMHARAATKKKSKSCEFC